MHPRLDFSNLGVSALGICSPHGFSIYKKTCSLKVRPWHSPCSPQGHSNSQNTQEGRNQSVSLAPALSQSTETVRKRQDSPLRMCRGASGRCETIRRG